MNKLKIGSTEWIDFVEPNADQVEDVI
ncbi:MAG: hypothetical protein QG650_900, partial [Patescibacteria group bacterium]|nr:hypothetical protein [Patescibacteria group bacterium]